MRRFLEKVQQVCIYLLYPTVALKFIITVVIVVVVMVVVLDSD